ncbi:hypothetical protein RCH06_001830 [Polaromonas sp. CG_9.5]|uniref:hypothetical protein n=1 Tax=Polaromonas sp. CG_9.5 TaxID=3071705 RepID=UPI002E03409D|nr:hypothetical protein [Polaromonas sp. CG_9.5]
MTAKMNTPINPVAEAIRLLRDNAESIKCCMSVAGVPMWSDDQDSKQLYDEHVEAADALERWAALQTGPHVGDVVDMVQPAETVKNIANFEHWYAEKGRFPTSAKGLALRAWDAAKADLPDGVILMCGSDLIPKPPTDPTGAAIKLKLVRDWSSCLNIQQWDNLGGLDVGVHYLFTGEVRNG